MTRIKEVTDLLESIAPLAYQESYDNAGLIIGNEDNIISNVLITLDCTEAVVEEAILSDCNLIICHHPIVFKGLKKFNGSNYVERTVIKAIKNDIAIYAIHTNLDNVYNGVNAKIAEKIGLNDIEILLPKQNTISKLVTFVPTRHTTAVLNALHNAGAGNIGNYSNCSFKVNGTGTFIPTEGANPKIGEIRKLENVTEDRVEMILPTTLSNTIIHALKQAHPYEEVAYYLSSVQNKNQEIGSGMIGALSQTISSDAFLLDLKSRMNLNTIKFTPFDGQISKVAICGGSGSFLLPQAKAKGADAFVTADFKYHEFFDAENQIMICDIGHYESEVFTKELIHDILIKYFTNFALNLSKTITNPISYI